MTASHITCPQEYYVDRYNILLVYFVVLECWNCHDEKIYIASHDHDFFQLLTRTTSVLREVRGRHVEYTPQKLSQDAHVSPHQYPLYLALKGDPSDNIEGIAGIGPKTAQHILAHCETVEDIFYALHDFPQRIQRKLEGRKHDILQLTAFFQMNRNIPSSRYQLHSLPGCHIERDFITNDLLKRVGFETCFTPVNERE